MVLRVPEEPAEKLWKGVELALAQPPSTGRGGAMGSTGGTRRLPGLPALRQGEARRGQQHPPPELRRSHPRHTTDAPGASSIPLWNVSCQLGGQQYWRMGVLRGLGPLHFGGDRTIGRYRGWKQSGRSRRPTSWGHGPNRGGCGLPVPGAHCSGGEVASAYRPASRLGGGRSCSRLGSSHGSTGGHASGGCWVLAMGKGATPHTGSRNCIQ